MSETAGTGKTQARGALPDGTDIPRGNWVDRWLPAGARPYARLMRLDRPIGTWLLLFPCWWSIMLGISTLSADWRQYLFIAWLFFLFGFGALVMRGAGCTYNDLVDRDFDGRVERTRTRPIPSGQVSVRRAVIFLCIQLLVGLIVLLQFNLNAILLGVLSLSLVFTYPLMKRVTYWPQVFLGRAFNWGALMGWTAVTGTLGWPPVVLYIAGIFWTLGYDTIYAHQDKEDDILIGVKSTAIKLGARTRPALAFFYVMTVVLMAVMGWLDGLGPVFFGALALGAAQLAWQVVRVDLDDPADCLAKFKANRLFGWLILAGLAADLAVPLFAGSPA